MQPLAIDTLPTPNPHALMFKVAVPLVARGTYEYRNAAAAETAPLARRLFTLDGVDQILVTSRFVTVNKHGAFDWPSLVPDIKGLIREHVDSGDPAVAAGHAVEALDTELGRLLTHVNFDRTTVLFLGDNGTDQSASEAPFLPEHAKGTMYEGGLNVPLIVAGSGVAPGENTALVHAVDFFATVAELAGVPGTTQDSISMVPYLAGDPTPRREYVYSERFKPNGPGPYTVYDQAVRGLRYKLIRRVDGEELYDLMTDPFERNDLLRQPSLTAPQRAAYRRLDVELARILAS